MPLAIIVNNNIIFFDTMKLKSSSNVIAHIIQGQSIGSVRLVVALFVLCSTVMKLLYDKHFPEIIDFDIARWTIIALGALFYLSTFFRYKSSSTFLNLSFILYLLTLVYVVSFMLINHFNPNVVTILILVMGASTIIINSIIYYGIQSLLIVFASTIVYHNTALSAESTIAFLNMIFAIGVFAIVITIRIKLISSVRYSYSYLEKLKVLSIIANKKGEIVYVSSSVFSLLGYEPQELLNEGWWKNQDLSQSWITRNHILNYPNIIPSEIISMERSVVTKEGQKVWVNWTNSVLPNGNYLGIALDITKYLINEKEKEYNHHLKLVTG